MAIRDDFALSQSSNGEKWTTVRPGKGFQVSSGAWSGKVYVAVGYGGRILTTSDFTNWSETQLESGKTLRGIHWSGKTFVATGDFGSLLTSPDGVTWTPRTSGTEQGLTAAAANDSMIVAVGENGDICKSATGLDWEVIHTGVENTFLDVFWDGRRFIASGDTVFVSSDGKQWIGQGGLSNQGIRRMIKTADTYYAAGNSIFSSRDLSTWSPVENLGNSLPLRDMAWNGSRLVATAYRGEIFFSDNGRDWKGVQTGTREHITSMAKSDSVYIAVGYNGTVLRSTDGVKWDSIEADTAYIPALYDVGWTGERFVAVGDPGIILSSRDGIKWEREKANTNLKEFGMVFTWNGKTLVFGEEGLVLHPDGAGGWTQTWLKENLGVDFNPGGAVFAFGEVFVAGSYGQIFSSADGYHWQNRRAFSLSQKGIAGLAWNGSEIVGVGTEFLRSTDGIKWESRYLSEFPKGLAEVAWTGLEYLAVGMDGMIVRGTNAFQWNAVSWDGNETLVNILVDGKRLFAVGQYGVILEASNDSPVMTKHTRLRTQSGKSSLPAFDPSQRIPLFPRSGRVFRPDGKKVPVLAPD